MRTLFNFIRIIFLSLFFKSCEPPPSPPSPVSPVAGDKSHYVIAKRELEKQANRKRHVKLTLKEQKLKRVRARRKYKNYIQKKSRQENRNK